MLVLGRNSCEKEMAIGPHNHLTVVIVHGGYRMRDNPVQDKQALTYFKHGKYA